MLQENVVQQPIDYRDIVVSYATPSKVTGIVNEFIREVILLLQEPSVRGGVTQHDSWSAWTSET